LKTDFNYDINLHENNKFIYFFKRTKFKIRVGAFFTLEIRINVNVKSSVAEPVERQHFAGAEIFWPGSGYVNSYKMLQKNLKFSY
jgi:hypothetical protein